MNYIKDLTNAYIGSYNDEIIKFVKDEIKENNENFLKVF